MKKAATLIFLVPRYFQWAARASKMGKRLGGFLPPPRLIPEIDGNFFGGRENRQGCVKELRDHLKPWISWAYVSKVQRPLIEGDLVVPTSQNSGRAGLQGNRNSRLLGAISLRKQRILKVNPLETARNQIYCIIVIENRTQLKERSKSNCHFPVYPFHRIYKYNRRTVALFKKQFH